MNQSIAKGFLFSLLMLGFGAKTQADEIERCSNEKYQVSIFVDANRRMDAVVSDQSSRILGQYEVYYSSVNDDFEGQGFFIDIYRRYQTPNIRNARFRAGILPTGESADADAILVCGPEKLPGGSCRGGQDRICH